MEHYLSRGGLLDYAHVIVSSPVSLGVGMVISHPRRSDSFTSGDFELVNTIVVLFYNLIIYKFLNF